PEKAARVEFQMRREEMRGKFDVGDLADLFKKMPANGDYILSKWFRMKAEVPDVQKGHQSRAKKNKLWDRGCRMCAEGTGKASDKDGYVKPVRQVVVRVEALLRQALGCLMTAQAVTDPGLGGRASYAVRNRRFGLGRFLGDAMQTLRNLNAPDWLEKFRE